jgi:hypothetical protein
VYVGIGYVGEISAALLEYYRFLNGLRDVRGRQVVEARPPTASVRR